MYAGDLSVSKMTENELGLALDWAADEGWNPGLFDAENFAAADPNGFFLGRLRGEPVGCVSAVAYDERFGFLGLYLVKAPYRGRGFGLKLWREAMDYLGGRKIGLDGVVAPQDNYRKSGFKLAYRNIRHEGMGGGRPA
jgi:GNAT superfamily N-acetyltransferase